ncbi:MAG: protein kinase [Bryobacteraceae bacterium]
MREERIGPYRLDRLLSEGGMGAVYLASRSDGEFNQQVAIKLMRAGAGGVEAERRLRTERQILATLDHPNIARMIDGGSTDDGQPYLVLEYVGGIGILKYAERNNLSTEERLRLFLGICAAVDYAHQRLIVHRDIKPGNILVTAEGSPKLLDFGIARLADPELNATVTAMAGFSPLYASPEQLEGRAITTSTDIYSLGVLFQELLTGRHPYRLQKESTAELASAILTQEPQALGLGGDLDAIARKALRKKPADRYASVEQLAADVERYLDRRPVLARRGSWAYRARRFFARNRFPVAAAALALAAVAGGVWSTLVQTGRAERRFAEVRQLANYLVYDFHDAVRKLPGSTAVQKDVVERSLRYLDRLAGESSGDPMLQGDLAAAYLKLGDVSGNPFQSSLRDTDRALESYRKAAELAEALPAGTERDILLARIHVQQGGTLAFGRAGGDGLAMLRGAVETLQRLAAANSGDVDLQVHLAGSRDLLARALSQMGGLETEGSGEAVEVVEVALRDLDVALERHPDNARLLKEKATLHKRLGAMFGSVDPPRSAKAYGEAFAALDRVKGDERNTTEFRVSLAALYGDRGWPAAQMGRYDDGIADYDKAVGLLEAVARDDPADASARANLTAMYRERGIIQGYAGRAEKAVEDYRKAAALHADLAQRDPTHKLYPVMRGELLGRIGRIELQQGDAAAARRDLTESLRILLDLADKPNAEANHVLEACKALYQAPLADLKDTQRTLELCEKASAALKGKSLFAWEAVGHARLAAGNRAGAVEAFENCLAMIEPPKAGAPKTRAQVGLEELIAKTKKGLP